MSFTAVVDASAIIEVVAAKSPDPALLRRLSTSVVAAPELLDVEVLGVLRRLERTGALSSREATSALAMLHKAPVERISHRPLVETAWEVRHNVHSADAFYLALARRLAVPVVTCDAKLAGSHGHQVEIEVYPVS
ncbi:MAG: type II toxin-antitoxin system VapC family toxin [Saccharothrix sp.]|nr:type II toxin-antitoxin system VapC family toxin [Saccharothrix sp.]